MGLSNEERYIQIIHCVNRLSRFPRITKTSSYNKEDVKKFNRYLNALWPALLAESKNSGYWIFGGPSVNKVMSDMTVMGAAFKSAKRNFFEKQNDVFDGKNLPDSAKLNFELSQKLKDFQPTALTLLGHEDKNKETIYNIYLESEAYFYGCNRYRDEFSKSMRPVTNVMSRLVGLCFNEFKSDKDYLTAWMMQHIFDKLIPTGMNLISRWFTEHNLHHNIRLPRRDEDYKTVYDIFYEYQPRLCDDDLIQDRLAALNPGTADRYEQQNPKRNVRISYNERVLTMLTIIGFRDKYHYDHQHQELIKMCQQHNAMINPKRSKKQHPDTIVIESVKAKCDELKKQETNRYYEKYCDLTEQVV